MNIDVFPDGRLYFEEDMYPCALGSAGVTKKKKEGDSATPLGTFPLRRVFYRPDKIKKPRTALKTFEITPEMGWCDDPEHMDYNRLIKLPHPGSYEDLWKLYDLFIELGYNDDPPIPGKGSAIFMHTTDDDLPPTLGCVALREQDLLDILLACNKDAQITIHEEDR